MSDYSESQPDFSIANNLESCEREFWELVRPLESELSDPLLDQANANRQPGNWQKVGSFLLGGMASVGALFCGAVISQEVARQITNFWPRH